MIERETDGQKDNECTKLIAEKVSEVILMCVFLSVSTISLFFMSSSGEETESPICLQPLHQVSTIFNFISKKKKLISIQYSTTSYTNFLFSTFLVLYIMSNVNVSTYSIYGVTLSLIYHIQPAGTRSNELKPGILI